MKLLKKCYTVTLYSLVLLSIVLLCSTFRRTPIGIGFIVPRAFAQNTIQLNCPSVPNVQVIAAFTIRTSTGLFNWGCSDSSGNLYIGNTAFPTVSGLQTAISNISSIGGGIVNAVALNGTQSLSVDIFNNATNVKLELGAIQLNISSSWSLGANDEILCSGRNSTIIQQIVNSTTGGGGTPGDGIHINGDNIYIGHCTIRGAAGLNPPQQPGGVGAKGIFWVSGNNVTIEHNRIDQWTERAIQIGTSSTGIRIRDNLFSDIGDEVALFSPATPSSFQAWFTGNECRAYSSFCVDSNASNTVMETNYVHDPNTCTVNGCSNASGISCGPLTGQTLSGCIIRNNLFVNLFAGTQGAVHPWAADGATLRGTVVSDNIMISPTNANQIGIYSELVGTGTGTITGLIVKGNFGQDEAIEIKSSTANSSYTNNTVLCLLSNTITGVRFDNFGTGAGASNGTIIANNTTSGCQTGAQTICTKCVIAYNSFSGSTTDYNNLSTAPFIGLNLTPNTPATNGAFQLPEGNNVLGGGVTGEEVLGATTTHLTQMISNGASAHYMVYGDFGTCTMSALSTCTFTALNSFVSTPLAFASDRAHITTDTCSISGTTVTITASAANSTQHNCLLIGFNN